MAERHKNYFFRLFLMKAGTSRSSVGIFGAAAGMPLPLVGCMPLTFTLEVGACPMRWMVPLAVMPCWRCCSSGEKPVAITVHLISPV